MGSLATEDRNLASLANSLKSPEPSESSLPSPAKKGDAVEAEAASELSSALRDSRTLSLSPGGSLNLRVGEKIVRCKCQCVKQ